MDGLTSRALKLAAIHRNTKGEPMVIRPGSFLADFYTKYWDQPLTVMKSTQNGISEWALVTMLALAEFGLSHFYVYPTEQLRDRFLSRFDMLLKRVQYYRAMVGNDINNKSLKFFGRIGLAFVGSNSESNFEEFPADAATIDEMDRCYQENLSLVPARFGASRYRILRQIGNPTFEGFGIAAEYSETDMQKWFVHGDCGHWNHPSFFEHLLTEDGEAVRDPAWEDGKEPRLICSTCGKPFNRFGAGEWVATGPSDRRPGKHVSKLFSGFTTLSEMIDTYERGLNNPSVLQHFYNKDLGLPHTAAGSRITEEALDACIGDYRRSKSHPGPTVIGIDPGARIHFMILDSRYRMIEAGSVWTEQDIDELWKRYNVQIGVIDAGPELKLVRNLMLKHRGLFRCRYLVEATAKTEAVRRNQSRTNPEKTRLIEPNRTLALDNVREMIYDRTLTIPRDAATIGQNGERELWDHLCTPVRIWDEKREQYIWVPGAKRWDLFHCAGYAIMANNLRSQINQMAN